MIQNEFHFSPDSILGLYNGKDILLSLEIKIIGLGNIDMIIDVRNIVFSSCSFGWLMSTEEGLDWDDDAEVLDDVRVISIRIILPRYFTCHLMPGR